MSTSSELITPTAVLMFPRSTRPLITYARAVYGSLLDNPSFQTQTRRSPRS